MGCYDSAILRPLLGSSSNNNETINNNNSGSGGRGFNIIGRRRYRPGYEGMVDDGDEDNEVKYRRNKIKGSSVVSVSSIMLVVRKVGLLVWKNLLLRRRHYVVTALEIILPFLFTLILVYGRAESGDVINGHNNKNNGEGPQKKALVINITNPTILPEQTENDFQLNCNMFYNNDPCVFAYAPKNPWTDGIIDLVKSFNNNPKIEWIGFKSEIDIEGKLAGSKLNNSETDFPLKAAIVFSNAVNSTSYTIRIVDVNTDFPREVMKAVVPWFQTPGPGNAERKYIDSGFTKLQLSLDKAIVMKLTGAPYPKTISLQPFPYPPYEVNLSFSDVYFLVLPMILVLGFIFIVPSVMRGVVNERETGIKELMKMSGMSNWMHWLAWIINSMLFLTISVTVVTVLLCSGLLNKSAGPIVAHGNPFIWWVVLMLFILSSTAFLFFISSFFQKPALAITIGILVWLITFFPPMLTFGDNNKYLNLTLLDKMAVALLPNMALTWALKVMCAFELRSIGVQFNNIFQSLSSVDELTLGHIIFMFLWDTVFYLLLTLYVESVLPSKYGIRKPWYFIFKPSYWIPKQPTKLEVDDDFEEEMNANRRGFEPYPDGLKVGVEIRNMKKKFGSKKIAVNGVSVKMFDGEIFALLGHNGAGKTTTMSCCIGMTSPTSGTAIINGHDIRTHLDEVQQHLGLCPQHNLFFDELTVMEHLMFFARMKGLSATDSASDSREMLRKLQMTEKTNTLARDLSGGQKRKLCLGVSLVGRAKVVFLDEPTSGMDVEARRAIWDLLLKERGQRTIILTTHFMEEADVLGDRIGIMANGQLQCVGTSLFLKKFYGTGYTLSLTTADSSKSTDILHLVNERIPHAEFKQKPVDGQSPCEWSIVIPSESFSTSVFPDMFKDLQENKEILGIQNVGLSLTTMDEVFVKAGEAFEDNQDSRRDEGNPSAEITSFAAVLPTKYSNGSNGDNSIEDGVATERLNGLQLLRQQFVGLILKRYSYTVRKLGLFVIQILIPLLLLIVAILSGNSGLKPSPQPPALLINLSPYKYPITLYSASDTAMANAYSSIVGSSAKRFIPSNSSDSLVEELLRIGGADLAVFRERHIVAADMNSTHFKAMYSTIPFHSMPLTINLMSNTILKMQNKPDIISVSNHPMEVRFENILQSLQPDPGFSMTNALMFGVLLPIGLASLAASFVVAPIEEKLCNGKQLQFMTGVNPITYWGSSFVWDYFVMINVIILMILCFVVFQTDHAYTSFGGAGVIFLILLTYGYSAIPFSYVCSLIAGTVPGGFSLVVILHMASGIVVSFAMYILEVLAGLGNFTTKVRFVARFFPTFGASVNTMRFVEIALQNSRCNFLPENFEQILCDPKVELDLKYRQCCSNCKTDFAGANCFQSIQYISWNYKRESSATGISSSEVPGIGQELMYMLLLGIFYQVLLIVLEYGWIKRLLGLVFRTGDTAFQTNTQDDDVLQEAQRISELVKTGKVDEDALVVENFSKSYGSFAAVSNLSFGVHHGECFGLLGVNGAGKTTTFRMLTGDELRSNGNAYSMMLNLESNKKQFLANIGYCPQFDGLIGFLTGREMVSLFGRLRGVKHISRESQKWLKKVGLLESADVQCRKYSGGMKRRLSAAMAMIGDPEIVLLDEPTSGVDPISRREFWKIISAIKASGRAIILTSHSMDEIAACCSRLGIMVNGQMQCLGTVQHLKSKYAQGYTLAIKLIAQRDPSTENSAISQLENRITVAFTPCSLKDKHQTSLQFHIQNASIPWNILFKTMEDLKAEFSEIIEEYSITETSLEEVFLAFARTQYPPRLADIPVWKRCITCQFC